MLNIVYPLILETYMYRMGIIRFKSLLVVGALVALTAYLARPVFPDTASNHLLKTSVGLSLKFINVASIVGGYLGLSPLAISRAMLGVASVLDRPSDTVETFTTTMDGIEVTIFRPVAKSEDLRPGIIHFHGGGWVHLSPKEYAPFCKSVVDQTQSVLISVNYRLAPEHVYPIPLEDCLKASRYFLRNAKEFGVDEKRIGVKGDSAGGNLAMAVALKLSKEKDLPSLKFMSLDYALLQVFNLNLPSYQKHEHGPGICTKHLVVLHVCLYLFGDLEYYDLLYGDHHLTEDLESKYAQYLNKDLLPSYLQNDKKDLSKEKSKADTKRILVSDEITNKLIDPLFAPLMASDEDLELLPPTYIFNAEFDVLRDDGFILAARLERLGKPVKMSYLAAEEHGFLNFVSLDPTVVDEIRNFAVFFNETLKIRA